MITQYITLTQENPEYPPFPPSEHSTRLGIDICLSESNFPCPSLISQPLSAFCLHLIMKFSSFKLSDGGKIALLYYTLNRNSLAFFSLPASPFPVSCLDQGAVAVPSEQSKDKYPIKVQASCPHEPFTVTDVSSKLPHLIPSVSHYLFTLLSRFPKRQQQDGGRNSRPSFPLTSLLLEGLSSLGHPFFHDASKCR